MIIDLPEEMDLAANCDAVVSALDQIREQLLSGRNPSTFIRLKRVRKITPEAALLLLAEINRCASAPGLRIVKGDRPEDERCRSLLAEIGYYQFFGWEKPSSNPLRRYVKAVRGGNVDGKLANKLISVVEHQIPLDPFFRSRIYGALIESMANVVHHAYRGKMKQMSAGGKWWMVGLSSPDENEIHVCFLDLGLGIPTTLTEKLQDRVSAFLKSETDLVVAAVGTGRSRHNDIRRGNGLPSLRALVDLVPEGNFRILSKRANVVFSTGETEKCYTQTQSFGGTLLSWVLKPSVHRESDQGDRESD